MSILLGNGAGGFSPPSNYNIGNAPRSVAVGDFNGDGKQDLAVANFGSNNVSILLGDGAGNFSAPTNFAVGSSPYMVVVGDFNGDGNQDLAVANQYSNSVSILLGDGAGNFGLAMNFGTGNNPHSVAVGDCNGDGKQDLAVAKHVRPQCLYFVAQLRSDTDKRCFAKGTRNRRDLRYRSAADGGTQESNAVSWRWH